MSSEKKELLQSPEDPVAEEAEPVASSLHAYPGFIDVELYLPPGRQRLSSTWGTLMGRMGRVV